MGKEHIYRMEWWSVFKQSIFIWSCLILHIIANIFINPTLIRKEQFWGIIFINIILSTITIPSLYIFINYLKFSCHRDFIIAYNSLKLVNRKTKKTIEIFSSDIIKIELYENIGNGREPWNFFEYFYVIDKHDNKIVIPSYILNIKDFWWDSLSRRVNSDKLVIKKTFFPIIKNI